MSEWDQIVSEEYAKLIEKLRRIEALHAGATTPGERDAAAGARERISERLAGLRTAPPKPTDYRFSLDNAWSRKLFLALARRNGYRPFKYPRQRYTSVMVILTEPEANALWSEFQALDKVLCDHLNDLAETIIADALSSDTAEAEVIPLLTGGVDRKD